MGPVIKIFFAWVSATGKNMGIDLPYFVRNGFWVLFRQAISLISGTLLFVAFTRLSSPEIFGQYQFVIAIFSTVGILSLTGFSTSIVQSVSRGYDGDYKKLVGISFHWSLLGIPALLIIGGYYYLYQSVELGTALMAASIFLPFFYTLNSWDSFMQGKSQFRVLAKLNSIQAVINSVAVIIVIFFQRENLLAITISYFLVYCVFNIIFFKKSLAFIQNEKKDEDTLKYGWFLTKISILAIIANNIDKILIGILISPEILAIYSVVSMVAVKFKEMLKPSVNFLLPKISNIQFSLSRFIARKKKTVAVLLLADACVTLIYFFMIDDVSFLLFGKKYEEFYYLSKYFFPVIFFAPIIEFLSIYIRGRKFSKVIIRTNIFQHTSRILLNIFFIYAFGLFGAILSINLSFIFWVISYIFFLNSRKIA